MMIRTAIIAVLIGSGCATVQSARIKRRAPASARTLETAEERLAAQRAANPRLREEDNEARWGLAQSKQRKEERKRKAAAQQKANPAPGDVKKSK